MEDFMPAYCSAANPRTARSRSRSGGQPVLDAPACSVKLGRMPDALPQAALTDFCAAASPEQRAALAERQLATLAAQEPTIGAFTCFDTDAARATVARSVAQGGPLAGALVGIKDIIATVDFP